METLVTLRSESPYSQEFTNWLHATFYPEINQLKEKLMQDMIPTKYINKAVKKREDELMSTAPEFMQRYWYIYNNLSEFYNYCHDTYAITGKLILEKDSPFGWECVNVNDIEVTKNKMKKRLEEFFGSVNVKVNYI